MENSGSQSVPAADAITAVEATGASSSFSNGGAADLIFSRPQRKRVSPMRRLLMVNIATILTGLLFVYDGLEPGWSLFTCVSLLLFSAIAITWAMASFQWLVRDDRRGVSVLAVLQLTATPLLAVTFAILVVLSVPARIGLWASRDQFNALLANAPVVDGGKALNRRVGFYDVLRYAGDGRGGVYFVTGEYRDSLSAESVSLGFAFHPSRQGTPFGKEHYRLTRVWGDWYTFAASDVRE